MNKKWIVLIAVFSVIIASAQKDDVDFIKRISDEILVNGKAYENLHYLTKKIGGRLAGSPQMVMAEKWGIRMMKENGADNAWMQECLVPHWVRGGKDVVNAKWIASANNSAKLDARLATKELDVIALGNSIGTGAKGLIAEVVQVNSFDELEEKKDQLKNKIVFYNYHFNPTFIETFRSYGDAVKYRGAGPSRAAKYGAVGVIIRTMNHSTTNIPNTGSTRYDDKYPKIPAVAVGLKDADWLNEQTTKGKVTLFMKTNGHFLPDTIGHNIIGELKGSEFPDEYITVGGHLDSWDPAEGAHDDGAGIVQTIEILRTFKALGYQPKHTIRFVLFANEENGLRGGTKYAEEAKAKNEKHIFALESDAGGFTPRGFGFNVTNEVFAKIKPLASLLKPYGGGDLEIGGDGSDISPLNRLLSVPTAGLSPDSQRYFDYHHTRNDVFENVNKRELELGAINMAALIYLVDKYGL